MDDNLQIDLFDFLERTADDEKSFKFAIHCGLLPDPSPRTCVKCGKVNGLKFQKNSRYKVKGKFPFMFVCTQKECRCTVSVSKNTLFDRSSLSLSENLRLIYFWLLNISSKDTANQLKQPETVVTKWYQILTEVCAFIIINYTEAIGGPGSLVEVLEYDLDDSEETSQLWVVTGVDRSSGHNFAIHVNSLDFETLWPVIKNYILPGSVVAIKTFREFVARERHEENPQLSFVNPAKYPRKSDDYCLDNMFAALKNYVQLEVPPDELDFKELYVYKFLYFNRDSFLNKPASELIMPYLNDAKNVYPGFEKISHFEYDTIDLNKTPSTPRKRR